MSKLTIGEICEKLDNLAVLEDTLRADHEFDYNEEVADMLRSIKVEV